MRRTILISLLALSPALLNAQTPAPDAGVVNAEKAWAKAVVGRDLAALDRILNKDLIYAHSTGAIESKADYIGRLKSGAQKYDSIEHQKTTVRLHGDAAVAHSIINMKGVSNGKPFDDHLMMLHVWVKQAGAWQLAAHQTTKLPQ